MNNKVVIGYNAETERSIKKSKNQRKSKFRPIFFDGRRGPRQVANICP